MVAIGSLLGLILAVAGWFLLTTPRPTDIKSCLVTKLYHVSLCPKGESYVPIRDISIHARNAVIVSEDGTFYSHHGFDWDELKNSFDKNMAKGSYARGGSTITQQLAKNVYLSSDKSLLRKVREALITLQLENILKKDEILEKYLNVVEFGPELYGIGPASQYYFSKPANLLSPAEGAFLAFLLPNPKKYSVSFRKKQLTHFAYRQISEIVDRLYRYKKLSDDEHSQALAQIPRLFGVPAVDPSLEQALDGVTPSEDEAAVPDDSSGN
jgi:monofunctional biosynthetic peptidoglycan transglycosylase